MKKIIVLVFFLSLNAFGSDKIEFSKNIVTLETDKKSFVFDIQDVLFLSKEEYPHQTKVFYTIRFKGRENSDIKYYDFEIHNKLIELFNIHKSLEKLRWGAF